MQNYNISVDFNNTESIKQGIYKLSKTMQELFEIAKDESYGFMETALPHITNNEIQLTKEELFENSILDSVIGLSCDLSKNNIFKDDTYLDFNNSLAVFTQCYLLQKALDNSLDKEVVKLAKQIVAFAVEVNDSDNLWYDDCNVYGIDLLTTLALNRPEHIHLISEYIIPYWDDEHAPYVFEYLRYFSSKFGFSRDMLKAYAYCNNSYNFSNNFSYVNDNYEDEVSTKLFEFFKQNKDEYKYFKKQYLNYLKEYPRSSEDQNFVHLSTRLFMMLLGDKYEENLNEMFHNKTLEEEKEDFSDQIDEVLEEFSKDDYPFVRDEDAEEEELEDYEEEIEDKIRINEEFFIKGLPNGNKIYDYILYGRNEEVLNKIPKITNLQRFAKENSLEIKTRFDYYGADYLWEIMEPFITHQLECEVRQSMLGKFLNKSQDVSPKQRALRAVDVLVRVTGQSLEDLSIQYLTQDYELCTLDELFKRYSIFESNDDLLKEIKSLMNQLFKDETSKEELEQLNALFLKDRELWDNILETVMHNRDENFEDDIVAVVPGLKKSEVKGCHLLTVAYIASKNFERDNKDIQKLINFYTNNLLSVFVNIFKEYGKTSYYVENDEINQEHLVTEVYEYCKGSFPPPPPKDILEKLMKSGVNSLNEDEMKIFEEAKQKAQNFKATSYDDIKSSIDELCYLNEEDKETKHLGREMGIDMIGLFSSDEMQGVLASIIYINKFLPMQFQEQAKRIYNIMLELAPVKTIHETSKSFLNFRNLQQIENNPQIYYEFIDKLEDFKVKQEFIIAWQINRAVDNIYTEYDFIHNKLESFAQEYLEKEEEVESSSMFAALHKKRKEALKSSIQYLDFETRRDFLKLVNEKEPIKEYFECCKTQFDRMLMDFAHRLTPWDTPNWAMSKEEKVSYNSEVSKRAKMIEDYLFNESSFDQIENTIVKENIDYVSDDLDTIIHYFDEDIKKRFLYLIGRLRYMNRVYDYFRKANEDEFETYGLTHKLFYAIKDTGIDSSFALLFIISQAMREENYAECEEEKNFIKAFYDIYATIDLIEASKDYKENKLIFIVRMIGKDETQKNQEIKRELLEKFATHEKLKIQKTAKRFLG